MWSTSSSTRNTGDTGDEIYDEIDWIGDDIFVS